MATLRTDFLGSRGVRADAEGAGPLPKSTFIPLPRRFLGVDAAMSAKWNLAQIGGTVVKDFEMLGGQLFVQNQAFSTIGAKLNAPLVGILN